MESNTISPVKIIRLNVCSGTRASFANSIRDLVLRAEAGYICLANVHMLVEARRSARFLEVFNQALMTLPDGKPLVSLQRLLSTHSAERFCGRDVVYDLCQAAENHSINVGFYGSKKTKLDKVRNILLKKNPNLKISFCEQAPHIQPHPDFDPQVALQIRQSKTQLLFVALGCPKQEYWMSQHAQEAGVVAIGIGAAVDFISGEKPIAPPIIQKFGMEWLYRLLSEPRRLAWRYLSTNTIFLGYLGIDLVTKCAQRNRATTN